MSGDMSVSSCLLVKPVFQVKSICLGIYFLHTPLWKKPHYMCENPFLTFFTCSCLTGLFGAYIWTARICNSVAFLCRSDSEMAQHTKKKTNTGNTQLSPFVSGVSLKTEIIISPVFAAEVICQDICLDVVCQRVKLPSFRHLWPALAPWLEWLYRC